MSCRNCLYLTLCDCTKPQDNTAREHMETAASLPWSPLHESLHNVHSLSTPALRWSALRYFPCRACAAETQHRHRRVHRAASHSCASSQVTSRCSSSDTLTVSSAPATSLIISQMERKYTVLFLSIHVMRPCQLLFWQIGRAHV